MHIPKKQKLIKLFGETAHIEEHEKDEARSYLNSWKKYLLRRLKRDSYEVKILDEQWGEIPAHFMGALAARSCLYLKIIIEFEWSYEDGNSLNGMAIDENWKPK